MSVERDIFKRASTTYYWSSLFFPKAVRSDVFKLYSFVRLADDYVDSQPQQRAQFMQLKKRWQLASADPHFSTVVAPDDSLPERAVKNIVHLQHTYAFDPAWIEAFLAAMQSDLDDRHYETLDDTLAYVYGSAEVIGLMMAKIMNLSPAAYEAAKLQGRAMQYINFIRDIAEDGARGRCYFAKEDLQHFGLSDLHPETAKAQPRAFKAFIQFQLNRYKGWQALADGGFRYIPLRPRVAVRTAADMYNWTGRKIYKYPGLVYEQKVKPARTYIVYAGMRNIFG